MDNWNIKKPGFTMFLQHYLPPSPMVIGGYSVHSHIEDSSVYPYPRLRAASLALIKTGPPFPITLPITPHAPNSLGPPYDIFSNWYHNGVIPLGGSEEVIMLMYIGLIGIPASRRQQSSPNVPSE